MTSTTNYSKAKRYASNATATLRYSTLCTEAWVRCHACAKVAFVRLDDSPHLRRVRRVSQEP